MFAYIPFEPPPCCCLGRPANAPITIAPAGTTARCLRAVVAVEPELISDILGRTNPTFLL